MTSTITRDMLMKTRHIVIALEPVIPIHKRLGSHVLFGPRPCSSSECDSAVQPLCSNTIGSSCLDAAAIRLTPRVFAQHFEESCWRRCPREAAVFGFQEEPAPEDFVDSLRLQVDAPQRFPLGNQTFLPTALGQKPFHALREGGGSQSGLQTDAQTADDALFPRSCTSRQHWRSVAPIVSLQSPESRSLKSPHHYQVDLPRQRLSGCCEVCKLHRVRVRSNVSATSGSLVSSQARAAENQSLHLFAVSSNSDGRPSSRFSTPIPIIFVHNHLATPGWVCPGGTHHGCRIWHVFPGRQNEIKAFSKKDEHVINRLTKTNATCLISPAILDKFVKQL